MSLENDSVAALAPHASPDLIRIHVIVTGRVQGVGFRWFTERAANQHRVTGFARNLADGTVEIEAQAKPESIRSFMLEVSMGPPHCKVERVTRTQMELQPSEVTFIVR